MKCLSFRCIFLSLTMLTVTQVANSGLTLRVDDKVCHVATNDDLYCPSYEQPYWIWVDQWGNTATIKVSGPNSVKIRWNGQDIGSWPAVLSGKSYSGKSGLKRWAEVSFVVNINGAIYNVKVEEFYNYGTPYNDMEDEEVRVNVNGIQHEYQHRFL